MIKLLGYLIIIAIIIFAVFGFLILLEYLKYFKRRIFLKLDLKLKKLEVTE